MCYTRMRARDVDPLPWPPKRVSLFCWRLGKLLPGKSPRQILLVPLPQQNPAGTIAAAKTRNCRSNGQGIMALSFFLVHLLLPEQMPGMIFAAANSVSPVNVPESPVTNTGTNSTPYHCLFSGMTGTLNQTICLLRMNRSVCQIRGSGISTSESDHSVWRSIRIESLLIHLHQTPREGAHLHLKNIFCIVTTYSTNYISHIFFLSFSLSLPLPQGKSLLLQIKISCDSESTITHSS